MTTKSYKNILTSIFAITALFVASPATAVLENTNLIVAAAAPAHRDPTLSDASTPSQPAETPKQETEPKKDSKDILQKTGDVFVKGGQAVGKGLTTAWNATSNFVSGIFKGAEPCSEAAETALKNADTNIEKTKLDTKQEGTEGKDGAKGKCVVSKCVKNYVPNDAKSGCEQSGGPCPAADIEKVPNATAGELKKGSCYITECGNGYHPSDDGKSCEQAELSEEDSKNKVSELKDNAQKMKDKEQSTANKALGAAAIGATGIGGMNLMSGMAEQKADDSAEEDMKAYLATFVCDYGQGRNIKGGERDIDLPGGNELFDEVNEYKALAADLKVRKEALGKTPGIEAEVIYDIAETGLYDNVGMGRQSGAYASLSKALMDENSEDAKAWAEQKADTASKVKTGAITAGIGAVGGLVGNLAINSGEKNKNKVDEINKKYDGLKQPIKQLEQNINQLPKITQCPQEAPGIYPDCKCTNTQQVYGTSSGCTDCPENEQPTANQKACECKQGYYRNNLGVCTQPSANVIPQCATTDENMSVNLETGECSCINGFDKSNDNPNKCICLSPKIEENGQCIVKQQQQNIIINESVFNITMPADSLFDLGKSDLKSAAYTAIGEFRGQFKVWLQNNPDAPYCIKITGHTDKTGTDTINKPLSERRATAVQTALVDDGSVIQQANTKTAGVGSSECQTPTKTSDQSCRKVTIEFLKENCS